MSRRCLPVVQGRRACELTQPSDMYGTWKRGQGHEWEVHVDDGSSAVVHRTELVLAPATVTEETLEAARQGRRKQTNRDHSVRPLPSLFIPPPKGGFRHDTCARVCSQGC